MSLKKSALQALLIAVTSLPALAADLPFDQTFLSDYSQLQSRQVKFGTDYIFIAPGSLDRLADFDRVMLDQPEILIGTGSRYKGGKPADLVAIAERVRADLASQLRDGGYQVVDEKGPGVMYVRLAVTDLELQKKKRGVLGYTPVGFVVKAGADAVRDMMDKTDLMAFTLQAELLDSQKGDVLGAAVLVREGAGDKSMRMSFDELDDVLQEYSARFRCRLDNARLPEAQRVDCLDPATPKAGTANGAGSRP